MLGSVSLKQMLLVALGLCLTLECAQAGEISKIGSLRQTSQGRTSCLILGLDGAVFSREWRDALWATFFTAASQRLTQSVERSSIVKRARGRSRRATGSTKRRSPNGGSGPRSPTSAHVRRIHIRRCCRRRTRRSPPAFRRHTLLPLYDCLYALQATIPHLTRSSLHRCLKRHGMSRLPEVDGDRPKRSRFKAYPLGYFHIDLAEVHTAEGRL